MMRILHTSDWHLGHVLYGYDRSTEQAGMMRQVAEIAAREQPDVMVVTGDIYHQTNPSTATQRLFTEGLLTIRRACPAMTIVVTAGNHDSPSRLEADSSLWEEVGVTVVGRIERREDGTADWERQIVEVRRGADGTVAGYVAAMPHVYPQNFPSPDDDTPREERAARCFQTLLDRVEARNRDDLPVVLTAHLAVNGSDTAGHDLTVGGMEWTPLASLGQGYDYLALGHIHCPQDVPRSLHRARYCGTPLPVSFDETYTHSVTIVDLERHCRPVVRTVEIGNPIPLITLPEQPEGLEEALKALEQWPDTAAAYIRLHVRTDDSYLPADAMTRALALTEGKACRMCLIKMVRQGRTETGGEGAAFTLQEVQETSPLDIARQYYREREGREMSDEMAELMRTAINKVKSEE